MTDEREGPTGQGGAESQNSKSNKENKRTTENRQARTRFLIPTIKPWADPVSGIELLNALAQVFRRYCALPDGAANALALWAVFSHAFDAFDISPRLAIVSPVPECGKTTVMSLLSHVCRRPIIASNFTTAVIFRMIELYGPTVLMDEADTYLHGNGEMAGILNSGHRRGAAYVWRCDASDYHPTRHSTWAPLAFAIIGKVRPPALASRCIIILMRRALPSEVVEALPVDGSDELTTLARKIARWTADNIEALKVAKPAMPQGFRNRLGDNWRPPFAIADLAGGDWPERARKAAMLLSGGNEPPDGTPLLAAIKRIFDEEEAERLPSQKLCQRLSAPDDSDEERPWELMTPKALAAQLKLFGIKSKPVRFGERTLWGYARKDFEDAFRRYLSEDPSETATSATLQ